MRGTAQVRAASAVLLCLISAQPARASEDCAKLVFNTWCLGGGASTLPRGAAVPATGTGALQFTDGDKTVHVDLERGRIVHVWREEPPGSWISYLDWRNKLIRIYGRGTEVKNFPPSATSRSSRLNAVIRGEGRAETFWMLPGWRVAVIWETQAYVQLSYRLQKAAQAGSGSSEGL